jgi:hypothetical protein
MTAIVPTANILKNISPHVVAESFTQDMGFYHFVPYSISKTLNNFSCNGVR